ncbi:hypothetical protein SASPL_123192 [Salvia splendens]|uniref:Uncharacterized protein n=1 Tax=Salvia splendens TaxID=180675 RepID=A0A8X8XPD4_SALSN|nr:hypothetical protein SASPL_123192 [Salvia splendens]
MYGMGFDHSFGLWFITRWLKPDLMIESGAFKGHSTWVLRQAMPDTPILSITPRHPEKYLKKGPAYVDGNCTYFAGKDFVDFGSMDWERVLGKHGIQDPTRVLVFFDDHQNELKRLKQAVKAGFKHLVFEDNYDTGTGDHYSLRQICDQPYIRGGGHSCFRDSDEARIRYRRRKFWEKAVDTDELCGPGEAWWGVRGYMRDDFNHSNKAITYDEHFQNSRFVESVLDVYWEVPPVAGPSLTHQTRYEPARAPSPIVKDGRFSLFQRLGLTQFEPSVFNGYTQMVYVQFVDTCPIRLFDMSEWLRRQTRNLLGFACAGRILSTEAIQAIQALKRAYRSDPESLPTHALRRLIKSDLTAALKELLRQDQCTIAAVVFSVIQSEYGADLNAYAEMVVALARKGMAAEIDALVYRMEEEAPAGIVRGESRGLLRMVKALISAERKESTVRIYEMMKKSGMGSTWEVDEYLGRVLSKGLRRFGEGKLADEVDSELVRLYKAIFIKS